MGKHLIKCKLFLLTSSIAHLHGIGGNPKAIHSGHATHQNWPPRTLPAPEWLPAWGKCLGLGVGQLVAQLSRARLKSCIRKGRHWRCGFLAAAALCLLSMGRLLTRLLTYLWLLISHLLSHFPLACFSLSCYVNINRTIFSYIAPKP